MRPTEMAHILFQAAAMGARRSMENKASPEYSKDLAFAVASTADGLDQLANGLRATYMLLEEVKKLLLQSQKT